ncbi:MAG: biopolymer transporter ExbD [Pirellulales bacterium]
MPLKTQHDAEVQLNLTPMIDVLFTLILFFMVAAEFSEMDHELEVDLPQVAEAGMTAVEKKSPRTILVQADGQVRLDQQLVALADLTGQLRTALSSTPDLQVVIQGDRECPFQYVAAAMAACREAGVAELGISVQTASTAAGGSLK